MKKWIITMGLMSATLLTACTSDETTKENTNEVAEDVEDEATQAPSKGFYQDITDLSVDHIHGIGYPDSGDALMLATHNGPLLYEDDIWKETTDQKHDYMGFQAVKDGFVSSGHPEPGSDYENPLGLLKSTNLGETFKQYAFAGAIDFHYLAASYATNRIYVINPSAVEGLDTGLHYTDDLGASFTKTSMNGLNVQSASNLAAHPEDADTLVIGSNQGLYVSSNAGEDFSSKLKDSNITYVTLGKEIGYAARVKNEKAELVAFDLEDYSEELISLPKIEGDNPIIYIAKHQTTSDELSIVTLQNDVYITKDLGESWTTIMEKGKVVQQ